MSDTPYPRRRRAGWVLPTMLAAACQGGSNDPSAESAVAVAPAAPADVSTLRFDDLRRSVTIAQEKFVGLATAMPEESYPWRPMEGVRSVGEVFVHVAADNYFVPAMMGVAPPAETGITADGATFQAYQQRTMSKAEASAALAASFEFLLGAMDATRGELSREMQLGSSTVTVGDLWIRAVAHLHEHLGQSIAYARSNEVVPPWSG